MHNQQYEDFKSFLLEKENIGIVEITGLGASLRFLLPVENSRQYITFKVLAGYYRQLIMPEVQRVMPSKVTIYIYSYVAVDVRDVPPDMQVKVKVYF